MKRIDPIVSEKTFTLTNNATGETYDLPVLEGTIGPQIGRAHV